MPAAGIKEKNGAGIKSIYTKHTARREKSHDEIRAEQCEAEKERVFDVQRKSERGEEERDKGGRGGERENKVVLSSSRLIICGYSRARNKPEKNENKKKNQEAQRDARAVSAFLIAPNISRFKVHKEPRVCDTSRGERDRGKERLA